MKKILFLALAVLMLAGTASIVFAEIMVTRVPGTTGLREVTYSQTYAVSTTITTSNRILAITYADSVAGEGAVFDKASAGATYTLNQSSLLAEVPCAAGKVETFVLPLPYQVTAGVVTGCKNSTGIITVWYE